MNIFVKRSFEKRNVFSIDEIPEQFYKKKLRYGQDEQNTTK